MRLILTEHQHHTHHMKLIHTITVVAALLMAGCANPYHEIEKVYYPSHFQNGKRLPKAEIAKLPKPKTPAELANFQAYRQEVEALHQRQMIAAGMMAASASANLAAQQQTMAINNANMTSFINGMNQRTELMQMNNQLSGINSSLMGIQRNTSMMPVTPYVPIVRTW